MRDPERLAAMEQHATWCVDYQPEMYAPTVPGRSGADGKPICVKCERSWTAHQMRYLLTLTERLPHLEQQLADEKFFREQAEAACGVAEADREQLEKRLALFTQRP